MKPNFKKWFSIDHKDETGLYKMFNQFHYNYTNLFEVTNNEKKHGLISIHNEIIVDFNYTKILCKKDKFISMNHYYLCINQNEEYIDIYNINGDLLFHLDGIYYINLLLLADINIFCNLLIVNFKTIINKHGKFLRYNNRINYNLLEY